MSELNKKIELEISTDTAIDYSTGYAQHSIQLFNCDNLQLMAKMEDESVDVILTDPPYLYLKNQKLEREFDEQLFFSECKRVLTKNGFIVMFGRGTSFYRWNTILDELGFNFKEEIIWNKSLNTSPLLPISRIHETISIFTKGKGTINKVKVPYLEMKGHDLDSVIGDVKRMRSILRNTKSLDAVLDFLKNNSETKKAVRTDYVKPNNPGRGVTTDPFTPTGDRCVNVMQSISKGLNEISIIKQFRDHYSAIHPTQKPVRLLERLLSLVIPKDKEREDIVVLDPFGGSFSTMEAVYNMGMQGVSCEIDKEYFEAGKERIESLPPRQTSLFD